MSHHNSHPLIPKQKQCFTLLNVNQGIHFKIFIRQFRMTFKLARIKPTTHLTMPPRSLTDVYTLIIECERK